MVKKLKLLLGTTNKGKISELKYLLSRLQIEIVSLEDIDKKVNIEEIGATFLENALLKASQISRQTNLTTLADDSGLVVPALNGEPGIFSARYAGEKSTDKENIEKLLNKLKEKKAQERNAYFQCVIAIVKPTGEKIIVEGRVDGKIAHNPKGKNGFGYDPIFLIQELGSTMAEIGEEKKSEISHRGMALKALLLKLPDFLNLR